MALLNGDVDDLITERHALAVDRFADGAAFRDYFKANYGPTIVAYRGIADHPDQVAELDAALAELGDYALAEESGMEWEYLVVVARRAAAIDSGYGGASPRPMISSPAIAWAAPAASVRSMTKPMWMMTQSPGANDWSGSMPMFTLRCSPATSTSAS